MVLSVFLVLLLDLRSVAVCHGLVPQWAHKHVNQKDIGKAFSSLLFFFFLGLVEGFFVFVLSECGVVFFVLFFKKE